MFDIGLKSYYSNIAFYIHWDFALEKFVFATFDYFFF